MILLLYCSLQSVQFSAHVEVMHDRLHIRPKRNPQKWVTTGAAPCTFSNLNVNVAPFVPRTSLSSTGMFRTLSSNLIGVAWGLVVSVLDCESRGFEIQILARAEIWF